MASTGKCPHCGGTLRSDEKTCPNCGAQNEHYVEDAPRTIYDPKTIEELKEYCAERGMPLLRMRFFIGEDYKEPKAFGIYRDGDNVVVYKNKADGSRAVRYRGPDEAHAVNELFLKLLSECHNRGIYPDGKPVSRSSGSNRIGQIKAWQVFLGIILYFALTVRLNLSNLFLFSLLFLAIFAVSGGVLSSVKKSLYKNRFWYPDTDEHASHTDPDRKDCLHFIRKAFSCAVPEEDQLSPREKAAAKKVGWVPSTLWVLLFVLVPFLLTCMIGSGFQQSVRARRAKTAAYFEEIMRDDGYYDFGDGRLHYNTYDEWYYTPADGSSEYWIKMSRAPRLPDGTRVTRDNEEPYFLRKDWDPSWPGSECSYSNRKDKEKEGYYDFGTERLYYYRNGNWLSSPRDSSTDSWSLWGSRSDYELTLDGGSSVSRQDLENYHLSGSWQEDWGATDIKDSSEWDRLYGDHSSGSSSSSSSSSDYDDWDSDDTDWDSDW